MAIRGINVNGEDYKIDYNSLENLPDLSQYQAVLDFDNMPIESSTNPITSGGVFDALLNYTPGDSGGNVDTSVTEGSNHPVTSGAVYDAIQNVYSDLDNVSNNMASDLQELNTQITAKLNAKVDAVSGKGLSTNDFTANYKRILDRSVEGLLPLASNQADGCIPIVVRHVEGDHAYNVWEYRSIASIIPSADDGEF